MAVRRARLIAIDGTHASGKTTLKYRVASDLRMRGINVAVLEEPARSSPLVDDVVLHNSGSFDIVLEAELFAQHIMNCARASRQADLIISDKTTSNVLAYTRTLLAWQNGDWTSRMIDGLTALDAAWCEAYDAVFYMTSRYNETQQGDNYRQKVVGLQASVDHAVQNEYATAGVTPILVPNESNLDLLSSWIQYRLEELGIVTAKEITNVD